MSAYVIVEMAVKNTAAKDRYSAAAGPIIKEHGGEFVAAGAWTALAGETGLGKGPSYAFPTARAPSLGMNRQPTRPRSVTAMQAWRAAS